MAWVATEIAYFFVWMRTIQSLPIGGPVWLRSITLAPLGKFGMPDSAVHCIGLHWMPDPQVPILPNQVHQDLILTYLTSPSLWDSFPKATPLSIIHMDGMPTCFLKLLRCRSTFPQHWTIIHHENPHDHHFHLILSYRSDSESSVYSL